jgi:hypothetical protein
MNLSTLQPPADTDKLLAATMRASFQEEGLLIIPSFLDPQLCARLIGEIEEYMRAWRLPLTLPEHGGLVTDARLMALLGELMPQGFSFHHLHTARHDAGSRGVNWHHDYEQYPQSNRSHLMVHAFFYPNGLAGEVGDLLVLPGSQRMIIDRGACHGFGTADLPGSRVIDHLSPGSLVLVHSAVLHARRPKPGVADRPRYFIDASYCARGIRWPAYPGHAGINAQARALGLDRRGPERLFDDQAFFPTEEARERLERHSQGSLTEVLP